MKQWVAIGLCAGAMVGPILFWESASTGPRAMRLAEPLRMELDRERAVASAPRVSLEEDGEEEGVEAEAELSEAEIASELEALADDELKRPRVENLAQQWAGLNFAAAEAWVLARAAGPLRDGLMLRLAFVRAQGWPAEAARLVVEEIPAGPAQAEGVMAVLHQWALADLDGAVAWVKRFPESDLRDAAFAELEGMASEKR